MHDPMKVMKFCMNMCTEVPSQVVDAVMAALSDIPGQDPAGREARALAIAPIMARDGWRFCPCFPMERTSQHLRIFDLVHTNMANRLAHRVELAHVPPSSEPFQLVRESVSQHLAH